MRILVVSNTCSERKYQEIFESRTHRMLDSNQKFFLSLLEGLRCIEDIYVDCVTSLPISYRCYRSRLITSESEHEQGVSFRYCGCVNYPIIRTISVGYNIRHYVRKYLSEHTGEKIVVLCDGLLGEANALASMLRRKHIMSIALVTDVPHIVSDMERGKGLRSLIYSFYGKKTSKMLSGYDGYIFLTEHMNSICNPYQKPYIIMECIVTPLNIDAIPEKKLSDLPVVLYAGKLHSDFGVLNLASAAAYLKDICEVWIYGGSGNCEEELQKLAKKHNNLKIHGVVSQSEIYQLEKNADILINPRPNENIFTRFSFPSKTAEYLMMKVPTVMYKLDGIPDVYDQFLHYIKENTPASIAKTIQLVLGKEKQKCMAIASAGREYIIQNKNHLSQAKRIVYFIKGIEKES